MNILMYIYIPHSSQLEAGIMCILCNTIYNDLSFKVMFCYTIYRAIPGTTPLTFVQFYFHSMLLQLLRACTNVFGTAGDRR